MKAATKAQVESWWEFAGYNQESEFGWGTEAEAAAYADWRTARNRSRGRTNAVHAYQIDDAHAQAALDNHPERGFNLEDELADAIWHLQHGN